MDEIVINARPRGGQRKRRTSMGRRRMSGIRKSIIGSAFGRGATEGDGTPGKPSAAKRRPTMSEAELSQMFDRVLQLSTSNKINSKNSWNLPLIDHLGTALGTSTKQGAELNFQKASCTLDASVKIYSYRVDDVWSSSYKVLENLARGSRGGQGAEGDSDDEGAGEGRQRRAGRRIAAGSTIEKNLSSITMKDVDASLGFDPLFRKMATAFDQGGARGLLLANVPTQANAALAFDADDAVADDASLRPDDDRSAGASDGTSVAGQRLAVAAADVLSGLVGDFVAASARPTEEAEAEADKENVSWTLSACSALSSRLDPLYEDLTSAAETLLEVRHATAHTREEAAAVGASAKAGAKKKAKKGKAAKSAAATAEAGSDLYGDEQLGFHDAAVGGGEGGAGSGGGDPLANLEADFPALMGFDDLPTFRGAPMTPAAPGTAARRARDARLGRTPGSAGSATSAASGAHKRLAFGDEGIAGDEGEEAVDENAFLGGDGFDDEGGFDDMGGADWGGVPATPGLATTAATPGASAAAATQQSSAAQALANIFHAAQVAAPAGGPASLTQFLDEERLAALQGMAGPRHWAVGKRALAMRRQQARKEANKTAKQQGGSAATGTSKPRARGRRTGAAALDLDAHVPDASDARLAAPARASTLRLPSTHLQRMRGGGRAATLLPADVGLVRAEHEWLPSSWDEALSRARAAGADTTGAAAEALDATVLTMLTQPSVPLMSSAGAASGAAADGGGEAQAMTGEAGGGDDGFAGFGGGGFDDEGGFDDMGGGLGDDLSMLPSESAAGVGATAGSPAGPQLVRASRRVRALRVPYARRAKRVDVRKLKHRIWGFIDETVPSQPSKAEAAGEDDQEPEAAEALEHGEEAQVQFSEAVSALAPEASAGVTVPFYFICVLHLANEQGLKLEGQDDLRDFVISRGQQQASSGQQQASSGQHEEGDDDSEE